MNSERERERESERERERENQRRECSGKARKVTGQSRKEIKKEMSV